MAWPGPPDIGSQIENAIWHNSPPSQNVIEPNQPPPLAWGGDKKSPNHGHESTAASLATVFLPRCRPYKSASGLGSAAVGDATALGANTLELGRFGPKRVRA